jgi:hypothetical protein
MTLSEIADKFGAVALGRFAALIVLFLVLRLIRLPLTVLVGLLTLAMQAVDRAVSTRLAKPIPPARPSWSTT